MIALGGVIGAGLFVGSSVVIKSAGPAAVLSFLITGEVLGQRPMSQRRDTLRVIERDSGCEGLLLRPLCAKLMTPIRAEVEGLVDRLTAGLGPSLKGLAEDARITALDWRSASRETVPAIDDAAA